MYYIQSLQRGIAIRDAQLRSIDEAVVLFQSYLHGPKFTGEEAGERKDWIATGDVLNWLRETMTASHLAGENASANWVPQGGRVE